MPHHTFIGFRAVSVDERGEQYNANFMVSFPVGAVDKEQVNNALKGAVNQFLQMHPRGSILSQMERTVNMVSR